MLRMRMKRVRTKKMMKMMKMMKMKKMGMRKNPQKQKKRTSLI